jgi:hypothetical protein
VKSSSGSLHPVRVAVDKEVEVAAEIDRALFEKAIEVTATALRGAMGGEGSQPPSYAAEVFKEIWNALKEGAQELPERGKTGF